MFEELRKMAQRHHRALDRDDVEIRARISLNRVRLECEVRDGPAAAILEEMRALLEETRPLMPVGTLPIEMTFVPVPMITGPGRRLDSVLTEVRMAGMTLRAPKPEEAHRSLSALRAMCADLGPAETRPTMKHYRGAGRRDYVVIEASGDGGPPVVASACVNAVGPAGALAKHLAVTRHARSLKGDEIREMARSGELARFSVTEAPIPGDELLTFDEPEARPDPETPEP